MIRGQMVKYVLTALITPDAIYDVLVRQRLPPDWVISIVDANGLRVARSRAHAENLGGRLSQSVQAVVNSGGSEGFGVANTLEGERIYTPFSRLERSGWSAVLGFPTALADASTFRALATYASGVLLSIVLGGLGAAWLARTVTRPMADLSAAAEVVGRREAPPLPRTSILEIRGVGAALAAAAAELHASEADRNRLFENERRARERAEAADRTKDEFLAVLSHELRTPLNAVYGWAKMLHGGALRDSAMAERAVNAIVRNADSQVQLIDDLLDVSRITNGQLRLDTKLVLLTPVLEAAVDAVRPAADAKGIQITLTTERSDETVYGDSERLQQVVWNLLANAVKFTPKGGTVHLYLERAESKVRIRVVDSGQGIGPDVLPHVFERFRQADASSTRRHGGLGLGLTLVKHLVEAHGGTVAADSAGPNQGAAFTVTLPIALTGIVGGGPPRRRIGSLPERRGEIARIDGLRVLLVDDDSEGAAVAEAILRAAGALVASCSSAASALATLRDWRPDVMVSDIEMPEHDGYALIRDVRALPADAGGDTPAIALTAYGRAQDRSRSIEAGYQMHVSKPADPGELTALIAALATQGRRRPRAGGAGPHS